MSIQDWFFLTASFFFTLVSILLIFGLVVVIRFYQKVSHVLDSVENTVLTSNKYLRQLQMGVLGTILGVIKLFR